MMPAVAIWMIEFLIIFMGIFVTWNEHRVEKFRNKINGK